MPKLSVFAATESGDVDQTVAVVAAAFKKAAKDASARAHRNAIVIADERAKRGRPPAPNRYSNSVGTAAGAEKIERRNG